MVVLLVCCVLFVMDCPPHLCPPPPLLSVCLIDDIIKLRKKKNKTSSGGRARKGARPGGVRQQKKLAERGPSVDLVKKKRQGQLGLKAKQLRQRERKTLQSRSTGTMEAGGTANNTKNKNNRRKNNKSRQQPPQHKETPILGVKSRLGVKVRGKGISLVQSVGERGAAAPVRGRGRGVRRGGGAEEGEQRPGSLLKAMR